MATGYIKACQSLPWCQSFDPGPYAWTWSGWRGYGSLLDEMEPVTLGGRARQRLPQGLGEAETALGGRVRWSSYLEVGRG